MVLLRTDEAGDEDAPLITTNVTRSILCVLSHTVMAVPVSIGDGRQLRLKGRKEKGGKKSR